MDTLTHGLLGAALGQVCFGRRLGLPATLAGALSAAVPDLDYFIHSAADPLLNIELHRHFTHSFAFSPVIALAVAAPWLWRASAQGRRGALLACGLVGCWSHILLDACTSYGTQFLVPFGQHRFGWDFISVLDPLFTLALVAGLAIGAIRRKQASRTRHAGLAALIFCAAYLALGALQKSRALAAQAEVAHTRGHSRTRAEVMPTMGNHLVWRSLYLHEGRIHSDRIRVPWFGAATVRPGASLPLVTRHDLSPAEQARDGPLRSFDRFGRFSEGWLARAPGDPAMIADVRYSLSAKAFDPVWGIRFSAPGAPTEVEWVNRSRERKVAAGELWAEISGADPAYRLLRVQP